jgi:hypothetical protein
MTELIQLGDIAISVTLKDVKNVHLSVHPPDRRVTLVAPSTTKPPETSVHALCTGGTWGFFTGPFQI